MLCFRNVFICCVVSVLLFPFMHGLKLTAPLDNYFLVALKDYGSFVDALQVARHNHYKFVKKIDGYENIFLFEKPPNWHVGYGNKRSGHKALQEDSRVLWASQQKILQRDKRDLIDYDENELDYNEFDDEHPSHIFESKRPPFNDELWEHQWYMSTNSSLQKPLNLNVLPVYEKGITGRNVRVAVLDDGIEYDHEDLAQNYDPQISWNYNEDNADPYPQNDDDDNSHGTRCAGEIAMMANNKKCGVGIAYNSRIGCIKMLGGLVYDLLEGSSLGFALDKVDIYSSSWGPMDNGQTMEQPGVFAKEALERGTLLGRNGLGSIYVWASGNGGKKGDNCNCDGYASSIFTITIGSADDKGRGAWYSEKCASVMTVTYSSGNDSEQMITTTDVGNSCTVQHTGTSASAPLAAGIIALGLEANPTLTWRDVQHITVRSATREPLTTDYNWQKNGAGLVYSTKLGFGLMDADAFVTLAQKWKRVPKQKVDKIFGSLSDMPATTFNSTKIIFTYTGTKIRHLEHVQVIITARCQHRGALELFLSSPSGTRTTILDRRPRDNFAGNCFDSWPFMSVATWSENPFGQWQLEIYDSSPFGMKNVRSVDSVQLVLYGTTHAPSLSSLSIFPFGK